MTDLLEKHEWYARELCRRLFEHDIEEREDGHYIHTDEGFLLIEEANTCTSPKS